MYDFLMKLAMVLLMLSFVVLFIVMAITFFKYLW